MKSKTRHVSPKKQLVIGFILYVVMILSMSLMGVFSSKTVYAIVVMTFGWVPLGVSLYWLIQIVSKLSWTKRSGTVTSSKVIHEINTLETSMYPIPRYVPIIGYKYHIGGKLFTSTKMSALSHDFRFDMESEAISLQQMFSVKDNIDVWTHPNEPENSIIVQGCSRDKIITMLGYAFIGVLLIGVSIFILNY